MAMSLNVPLMVYISQLIRFARASSHVTDFNNRNKFLTVKLLKQGYRYHKLRKAFSRFYCRHVELIEKYHVSLKKLMQQGICNPEFYGDLVYKFKKIFGSPNLSYGVYISQLIRFARASSHVTDFNNRNKFLTVKLLKQGYRYHKLRKAFSRFYRRHFELIEKYHVSLKKLMQQGICNPEFYGDLVYKFKKIFGIPNFSNLLKRIVNRFKRAGYSLDIMRQTACLVFNPIMVEGYATLFSCTAVVQALDSMTAST